MGKRRRKMGFMAGVLALLAVVWAVWVPPAYGAGAIDTDKTCTLTLEVTGDALAEELSALSLEASLYKVASIDETGRYTALAGFESLGVEAVTSETTADAWLSMADQASDVIEASGAAADAVISIANGTGTVSEIPQGLYLVAVANALDDLYEYSFQPYLISLPDNRYQDAEDDSWLYEVTAGLKPEQTPRLGDISVTKTLDTYNTSLGDATFVFHVVATYEGETVYDNMLSTTHSAAGSKSVTVTGLPAGAEVTVTEVYSGASYVASGSASASITVAADSVTDASFTNTYNGGLVPAYGVTNHFEAGEDGEWTWVQQSDNSESDNQAEDITGSDEQAADEPQVAE